MTRTRLVTVLVAVGVAVFMAAQTRLDAHNGPPFPIVSNRVVNGYSLSVWTDPDTTDDGSAAGQFWVVLESANAAPIPQGTEVIVSVRPLDRPGPINTGHASPVNGAVARQFIALEMDHEGRFEVKIVVNGPLGRAEVESAVDATYDLRPAPGLIALYLFPFVAIGALWAKVLVRRRRKEGKAGR